MTWHGNRRIASQYAVWYQTRIHLCVSLSRLAYTCVWSLGLYLCEYVCIESRGYTLTYAYRFGASQPPPTSQLTRTPVCANPLVRCVYVCTGRCTGTETENDEALFRAAGVLVAGVPGRIACNTLQ